ncbi:MAG: RnfH family protein [Gammaproteobacteria bacterium]|nr:RnfH family protein [Gammaproteobacteria bacterium]
MEPNMMTIEVAYALPRQQFLLQESVPVACTVSVALARSNIHQLVPHIEIVDGKVGVFGKVVKMTQQLRPGDRIEIYRPLVNDPKEARRRKAAEKA